MSGLTVLRERRNRDDRKAHRPWPTLAALVAGLVMSFPLWGVQRGVYAPPNPHGFTHYQSYDADGDGDEMKETRIDRYLSPSGDSLFSMTTGDRLWAWSLATHGAEPRDLDPGWRARSPGRL